MALNAGSGFSKLAEMDSQIQAMLAAYVEEPTPKHQHFVSKKKEARRLREAKERELAELRDAPLDELIFSFTAPDQQLTPAAKQQAERDELEQQMRLALGIDTAIPSAVPPPKPKAKAAIKPLIAKPSVPVPVKPRVEFSVLKRRVEVLLRIRRPDGLELPFFHEELQGCQFEAELAAGRKARSYGFTVLSTIQISIKEEVCEHRA
jgi:hypothetical protein